MLLLVKKSIVDADTASGAQSGVTGTLLFINGRLIAGAYPFSEFKKIIDEELAGGQNKPTEARANVEIGGAPTKGKAGESNYSNRILRFPMPLLRKS